MAPIKTQVKLKEEEEGIKLGYKKINKIASLVILRQNSCIFIKLVL